MSRRLSSGNVMGSALVILMSGAYTVGVSYSSGPCFSRRVRSRRTWSTSLRCATEVIHAPGFSGTPFAGQLATAVAKASCIASSARSNDPEMRIKVARMRPDSWRKTDSIVLPVSAIASGSALGQLQLFFHGRNGLQRAYFNATFQSAACRGDLCRPADGFVLVFYVQDVIPRQLLLGLCKRAVSGHMFVVFQADRLGRAGILQRLAGFKDPFGPCFLHHRQMPVHRLLHLFLRASRSRVFPGINQ